MSNGCKSRVSPNSGNRIAKSKGVRRAYHGDGEIDTFLCITCITVTMFASANTPPLGDNMQIRRDYTAKQGEFIKYKGRSYAWVDITDEGKIVLTNEMMSFLRIKLGMKLLSIRSSDIAFTMGAYGRLVEESKKHEDEIPVF